MRIMLDFAHEITQTLSHNKLRTALTGIAVTWGVFMLIVLLSVARGVTNGFERNMMSRNSMQLQVWGGTTSIPYHGNREGRDIIMEEKDLSALPEKNAEYVKEVTSRIRENGIVSTPSANVNQGYSGVFPDEFTPSGRGTVIAGRFISDKDLRDKAKVMVIPDYYAAQLFPPGGKAAIGKRADCRGLSFLIVGVYESEWNRELYIPFTTARMMSSDSRNLGNLKVDLKNVHTEEDGTYAEDGVRNTLARLHDFDPSDNNAVYISNYFNNSLTAKKAMAILDTGVWTLGILTLLTGIVGISNIMFVTVRERTHEIGIRRAIGAGPHQILGQVILESVAVTVLFGYMGIVLGMIVSQVIDHFAGDFLVNSTVSLRIAFEVTTVLVFAGALAGLFPDLKALKVKPVEELRDE